MAVCCASLHSFAVKRANQDRKVISFVGSNLCSVVLAKVDGRPLTADAVKKAASVYVRSMELSSKRKLPALSGHRGNNLAMRLTPQLVSAMILDGELERLAIKSTTESDAAVLATYNKKFKKSAKTLDELASLFGDQADEFKKQFARESRNRVFLDSRSDLRVTDEEVDRFFLDITNKLKRVEMINNRADHQIKKAWAELNTGISWESVATNYTEDAELDPSLADNWKDWISLDINKIEPMELMVAVSKLKVGGFTEPIETDEGMVIVKLLSRDDNFCHLARILVRMGAKIEVPTREMAQEKIARDKKNDFYKKYITVLKKKAKLELPFGTKFEFKIWDDPDRVRTKKQGAR